VLRREGAGAGAGAGGEREGGGREAARGGSFCCVLGVGFVYLFLCASLVMRAAFRSVAVGGIINRF